MSGHSKWSNIQHRKHYQDNKKSKKFSKIIKEITSIIKKTGTNNFRFKNIISNAKSLNIPKSTINKAIEKAFNSKKNDRNLNLEGKINGINIFIECMTNNTIRTISNIKTFFNKNGGKLCKNGELIHFFNRICIFTIDKKNIKSTIDNFELMLIDFGAKDILKKNNIINIFTDFEYFGSMKNNLEKLGIFYKYELKRIPIKTKKISNEKKDKTIKFIYNLKKNDDIENIYSNLIQG